MSPKRREVAKAQGSAGDGDGRHPVRTAAKAAGQGRHPVRAAAKAVGNTDLVPTAVRLAPKAAKILPKKATTALARRALRRMIKRLAEEARQSISGPLPQAIAQAMDGDSETLVRALRPQLPIQRSIDVAVPLTVAWREWMKLRFLPEGVDRVRKIRRDGDGLRGVIAGPEKREWRAEILDERRAESFAWRSQEGSDCAGLITFHSLSDRLTRLELNLDVVPRTAREAVALNSHLAHRRAEADLRRFKARVELISPDMYEQDDSG